MVNKWYTKPPALETCCFFALYAYESVTLYTSHGKSHLLIDLHDIIHVRPHLYSMPSEPCYHWRFQISSFMMGPQYKWQLQGSSSSSSSPCIALKSFFHPLCRSSGGLMGVADRWQSHFHSSVVPCYLGAKPCNSYKCHIKSQPGRWEWQSDREAIHNCHYVCLCGWHPQIEMCSCSVPVRKLRHV